MNLNPSTLLCSMFLTLAIGGVSISATQLLKRGSRENSVEAFIAADGNRVSESAIGGRCRIMLTGRCATFGRKAVIKNDDRQNAYEVTVKITWRKGTKTGTVQIVKRVAAGGEAYAGCTDGGGFPRKTNSFKVVGQRKL